MNNKHFDIKRASKLDKRERLAELNIDKLLSDVVEIKEGMTCVDLGSGTGVFSFAMADHVGGKGVVYAVDDSNNMLDYIRKKKPPQNMLLIYSDAGKPTAYSIFTDY